MKNVYRIAKLIQAYVSGKVSTEEREEVEHWIEESDRHRELFRTFESEEFVNIQRVEHEWFDEERGFRRFILAKRTIDKRRVFRRVATIAATFVLLIGVCLGRWVILQEKESVPLVKLEKNSIVPGERKAVLVLSDGEHVDLRDAMQVEIVERETRIFVAGDSTRLVVKDSPIDPSLHTVFTPVGGEYKLTLSDGTRVWLNASSRIQFPAVFRSDRREVRVEGEVYFEVSKDSARPFLVRTGDVVVKVLGTSFNVRAYPGEEYKTTLVEGSVAVGYLGETMKIRPGQQWVLEKDGPKVHEVKIKSIVSWKNGDFAFEDQVLPEVFNELERWYDIDVFMSNDAIRNMKFTGIFPRYENINDVLHIIELATCVKCSISGKTIVVSMDK